MEELNQAGEESPAQRQARLRREKREQKIRDSGASRLDKITSLSGRKTDAGLAPLFTFENRETKMADNS